MAWSQRTFGLVYCAICEPGLDWMQQFNWIMGICFVFIGALASYAVQLLLCGYPGSLHYFSNPDFSRCRDSLCEDGFVRCFDHFFWSTNMMQLNVFIPIHLFDWFTCSLCVVLRLFFVFCIILCCCCVKMVCVCFIHFLDYWHDAIACFCSCINLIHLHSHFTLFCVIIFGGFE